MEAKRWQNVTGEGHLFDISSMQKNSSQIFTDEGHLLYINSV